MKTIVSVLAVVFALLIAACAGGIWYFSGSLHRDSRNLSVAHVSGSALQVETKNGAISVVESAVERVEITATIKAISEERLAATEVIAERGSEGRLQVGVAWPGGKKKLREACAFDIRVPPGITGITLTTSNGAVTTEALAGDASLRTSNGRVTVDGHDGAVTVKTSNGRIEGSDITGSVRAESSNGSIDIALADSSSGPVHLKTSNGSVTLRPGASFSGTITMNTSNGSLRFKDAPGVQILKRGKKHAEIRFGDSSVASSIKTSNGSIRVE